MIEDFFSKLPKQMLRVLRYRPANLNISKGNANATMRCIPFLHHDKGRHTLPSDITTKRSRYLAGIVLQYFSACILIPLLFYLKKNDSLPVDSRDIARFSSPVFFHDLTDLRPAVLFHKGVQIFDIVHTHKCCQMFRRLP